MVEASNAGSRNESTKVKFEQIFDNLDSKDRKTKIICTMG
jgi:hypothetical protein